MKAKLDAIIQREQAEYLDNLLPASDSLLTEMEDYAAAHRVPIADREVALFLEITAGASKAKRALECGMAIGYSFTDEKFAPALDWDMSWAGGAGALYSTVGDLFRWNEALFGGRVENEASFNFSFCTASRRFSYSSVMMGNIPAKTIGLTS